MKIVNRLLIARLLEADPGPALSNARRPSDVNEARSLLGIIDN